MSEIRFGVLGCASVAERLMLPAMKTVKDLSLIAVASRDRSKAIDFSEKFDCIPVHKYESLLDRSDVDAIYMPLPTGLHLEWAHKALDAGKHLLVEKSLACTYEDAKSIVEKAKEMKLLVIENYMFEFHSQQQEVKKIMNTELGAIRVFRANFGFPPLPVHNFRYDKALGGGALLDAGGYVLKSLSVFFPNFRVKVLAAHKTIGTGNVDVAGSGMLELHNDEGLSIPVQVTFGFDNYYQCGIEVWGSNGMIRTDRTFTSKQDNTPSVFLFKEGKESTIEMQSDNHFRNILLHFQRVIETKNFSLEYRKVLQQAQLQEKFRIMADL